MQEAAVIGADVETIVWDLDGTLLDSFGIYRDCLNQTLRERGRPEVPETVLRNHHHGFIEDSIVEALAETGAVYGSAERAAIFARFYELDNAAILDVDHHLFADAADLAARAHKAGKRQLVVTNRPHGVGRGNGSPRNLVANSRLQPLVDAVLCGDDNDFRKPHREFLAARYGDDLQELGKLVVVGDQFVDAEFARNLGGSAILVARTGAITHLDRVPDWQAHTQIVATLANVTV
jgi:phosphoglycolate phosphatase-like HAD superfamily hydrolase